MLKAVIFGIVGVFALSNQASALCTSYPNTLTNGTTADATQVMANFNCAALTSGSTINGLTLTGATTFPGSGTITSGGIVGIGTASPVSNAGFGGLTLNGPSGSIISQEYNGTETLRIAALNGQGSIQYPSGGLLTVYQGVSGGTEVARFDSSGRFYSGTTAAATYQMIVNDMNGYGHVAMFTTSGGGAALQLNVNGSTGTTPSQYFLGFSTSSGLVGSITSASGTSTSYNTTSDARLKQVDAHQPNVRATIENLWVGSFHWRRDSTPGFGILAQQAYSLVPYAVSKPADKDGIWQADYSKLAPLALWGVKDLYKMVDNQKARIEELDREIGRLHQVNNSEASDIQTLKAHLDILERQFRIRQARN